MGVTLLTGATGTLGSALRPRLSAAGHEVRAASRSPPDDGGTAEWVEVDLATGAGLDAALDDVDVVVHAATAPRGDTEAVDVDGTRRLLTAATEEAVENVVYPSIVGIDDIPYSYYEHKLTAERLVADSDVPSTVLRATQFHSFVHDLLGGVARLAAIARDLQRAHPGFPLVGSGYSWLRHLFPQVAAGVVGEGWAGLVGLGRGALAYPGFARDILRNGRMDAGKACITCGKCTTIMRDGGEAGCVVRDAGVYGPIYRRGRRAAEA